MYEKDVSLRRENRSPSETLSQFTLTELASKYGVPPEQVGMIVIALAKESGKNFSVVVQNALIGPQDTKDHVLLKLKNELEEEGSKEEKALYEALINWIHIQE